MRRGLFVVMMTLIAVSACSTSEDRRDVNVHCFNQQARLTMPAFISTDCPTINPTP